MDTAANSLVHPDWQANPTQAYAMETAVLYSVLIGAETILPRIKFLKPEHFILQGNQWVFQAMLDLKGRGEDVDTMTVIEELRVTNKLDKLDHGALYVTEYLTHDIPSHLNVQTYANGIYEAWRKRKTLELSGHIANAALHSDTAAALQIAADMSKMLSTGYQSINPLKPYFIKADELKNLPPISWLIDGEIPEMGLIALYGPPGIGKSFVALDYALQLAQEHAVVYIASEGQVGYARRVEAWCKHHQKPEGKLFFLLKDVSMLDDTERTQFIDLIGDLKPCMVIIDTLAQSMAGGDENSTRDMSLFIRMVGKIQSELHCAVMLVHHTGKQGGVERGSSVLRGACDTMIKLIDKDDQIEVECSKMKDGEPFEAKFLRLLPVEITPGNFVPVIIPDKKVMRSENDPPTQRQLKVLRALSGAAFADGVGQAEISEASGVQTGSIHSAMNGLFIRKMAIKKGQSFVITDKGRNYLRELGQLEYDPPNLPNLPPTRQQLQLVPPHNHAETRPTRSNSLWETSDNSPVESGKLGELGEFEREPAVVRSRQSELISLSSTAPRTPCPVCSTTNYRPDPFVGWKCATCDTRRRQLDETAEV